MFLSLASAVSARHDRLPRILLGTQLICGCVTAALAALGMPWPVALIHSLAIGNLSALAIHAGRWGWVAWQLRARPGQAAPQPTLAQRQGWPGRIAMAVVLVVAVGLAYPLGGWIARRLLGLAGIAVELGRFGGHVAPGGGDLHTGVSLFALSLLPSLVGTLVFRARGRLAAAEMRVAELGRQAAEAELRALQSQLEPHMLFNTLANLRALIALDPPEAQRMLDHLIAWLRRSLSASRLAQHPLADEFEHLRDYLALMAMRMGPRLQVRLDLAPDLAALPLPPLLLQPLVENAIRHGLEPARRGGLLQVRVWREADALMLEVADSGVGLPAADAARPPPAGTGFGLHQVRERLATLHGSAAALTLTPRDGGGTVARIRLPWPVPAVA
ncbi:MAG: hypothetical protein RLY78_1950 [Pseudomonadota bacterium]